jgi:hypothetical protein
MRGNVLPSRYARMQMLKKLDVNKATLANTFLETKALREFLADPVFTANLLDRKIKCRTVEGFRSQRIIFRIVYR